MIIKDVKPKVGVVMTLLELYRDIDPERPEQMGALWQSTVEGILSDAAELHFTGVSHTEIEVSAVVRDCEDAGCDLLIVLPLAYAPSGAAAPALIDTDLPLVLLSTCRDETLPHDMAGDHIMANHAMHGIQDLANVLARQMREFELIAGHHASPAFREALKACVRASAAASVLRAGRAGRIGSPFPGMLDFAFALSGGGPIDFETVVIDPGELATAASQATDDAVGEIVQWAKKRFEVDPDLGAAELEASARWSAGLERVVEDGGLDALSLNFLDVGDAAAPGGTVPFLGAGRLMSRGIGYAGEGDVLTAILGAAVARLQPETTFTEMFCPDYARDEVLLSHMGECNFELAVPDAPVKLVAKPFPYAACGRPAVPVFQLKPGPVTLVSLTEWPGESFRIIAARGEIVDAPEHPNLQSPYSRISFGRALGGFLEDYSRAGGTHHLALGYGDLVPGMRSLAGLCRIGFVEV